MNKEEYYLDIYGKNIYCQFLNRKLLSDSLPVLIFLHEGLGSVAQWKDFPEILSNMVKLPALVYDREGHGKSDALKQQRHNDYLKEQAQIVLPEILKKNHIENYKQILIGHSDGGSIAIMYAGTFPEKIAGIITEAAHLFLEDISCEGIRDAIDKFENGNLKIPLSKYHKEKTESMFYGWAHTWLKPEMRNWNIEHFLTTITAPFLAIQGTDDQYGSYEQLKSIEKHCKHSEIFFIPNCGHIPHQQAKDLVIKKIYDFITTECI